MRAWRALGITFAALLIAGVCGADSAAVLARGVAVDTEVDDYRVDDAVRFRSGFGLRSDIEYVRRTVVDSESFPDDEWGVPLSVDEAAELRRRAEVQDAIAPVSEWAQRNLPSYGGTWIDQSRAGIPVLMVRQGATQEWQELNSRIPAGIEVEIWQVDRSLDDLFAVRDRIESDRVVLDSESTGFVSTAIDVKSNTVIVGLALLSDEYRAVFTSRYGEALSFRHDPHAATFDATYCLTNCAPPEKGGIATYNASHGQHCTTGFMVKMVTGTVRRGILTAGHCFVWDYGEHGEGEAWRHSVTGGYEGIGHAEHDTWFTDADADVGFIDFTGVPADRNNFVANNSLTLGNVVHKAENAEQPRVEASAALDTSSAGDVG